jgi:hypothetical protein
MLYTGQIQLFFEKYALNYPCSWLRQNPLEVYKEQCSNIWTTFGRCKETRIVLLQEIVTGSYVQSARKK